MDEMKLEQEAQAAPDAAPELCRVVDVQFRTGSKIYFFDPGDLSLNAGDHVIIETARGPEYGLCASSVHEVSVKEIVPPLRSVLRKATKADERTMEENREKERKAFEICQQKIQEHGLDMQLVSAEYAFDGSKILFFFTADDRVDFRELVRNLASVFRTRIELRQIGVRDKAKMVGGLGICGRPFCCKQFLDDFQPVSIKMAKTQNLSLNPTKISGTCGRLMCCLKYEQEAYEDLIRTSPKQDSFVDTPDGRGTVTEVNLLRQSVKVRMEDQPEEIGCYQNCEICVLRNGKAKKTDPPIPADLAPISGSGKRPRMKEEPSEPKMSLEPIRFRYRSDEIVPEESETQRKQEVGPENQEKRPPRRRRRRSGDGHPGAQGENKPVPQKDAPRREGQNKPKENVSGKDGQNKPRPQERKPESGEKQQGQAKRRRNGNHRPRYHGPKPGNGSGGGSTPAPNA